MGIYSITSLARSRIEVGTVTPIALAVFRLTANSMEFCLFDRQVGGLRAAQDFGDVYGGAAPHWAGVDTIRHQPTVRDVGPEDEHARQAIPDRKLNEMPSAE